MQTTRDDPFYGEGVHMGYRYRYAELCHHDVTDPVLNIGRTIRESAPQLAPEEQLLGS